MLVGVSGGGGEGRVEERQADSPQEVPRVHPPALRAALEGHRNGEQASGRHQRHLRAGQGGAPVPRPQIPTLHVLRSEATESES
eukprot:3995029-Pyramimonas_sp.AAC.1